MVRTTKAEAVAEQAVHGGVILKVRWA